MTSNHPTTDATLCFIVHQERILLIMKKRGFGEGKVNAPGGKVSENETITEAAIRETKEETGLIPINPKKYGILDFYIGKSSTPQWRVHVFVAIEFHGALIETQEAKGYWSPVEEIPYEKMWEDDKYWLPLILEGKLLKGKFWFSNDMKKLLDHKIKEISNGL